ncbi:MAG: phosphatase PAP2 family protein [Calditrichaeota bacterium]|nr:phosphatase PAP2 family protein [Calditrichota bacterium]
MTEILAFLNHIDTILFVFINVHLANPLSDFIMPIVTNKHTWYPIWAITIILLLWKGGTKGRWVVLVVLLAVASADQLVNQFLKPLFHRIRPCHVVEGAHLLMGKKSSFSMPSSHAANFFTLAAVFSYYYRKYQYVFWALAALVAYSRVAVGVHYPFDVLAGSGIGILIGWFWVQAFKKLLRKKNYDWL